MSQHFVKTVTRLLLRYNIFINYRENLVTSDSTTTHKVVVITLCYL